MRKITLTNCIGQNNRPANQRIALIDWEYQELSFPSVKKSLERTVLCAEQALKQKELPFLVHGEHLLMLGALRAVCAQFPQVHIIHFDARPDLRESFLDESLSSACVMRKCWNLLGDGRIYQFGVRHGNREEFRWAKEHVSIRRLDFEGLEELAEKLEGLPVYFTIDLDVLNPVCFPGAVIPQPGGVSPSELLRAAQLVCRRTRVVGCDVSELSQCCDSTGQSKKIVNHLIDEMLRILQTRHSPESSIRIHAPVPDS